MVIFGFDCFKVFGFDCGFSCGEYLCYCGRRESCLCKVGYGIYEILVT